MSNACFNELAYRQAQRRLGEIQAGIRLVSFVAKEIPDTPGLECGLISLIQAKNAIFASIKRMEDGV